MRLRVALLVGAVTLLMPLPAAARAADQLEVSLEPTGIVTTLGLTEAVVVTVTNTGTEPAESIAVHIDITDPLAEESVDPEDWTPTLTKGLGDLGAGQSKSVTWEIQPISSGTFSMYAVVLGANDPAVAASNAVTIEVQSSRTLNPEGVLPVALSMPLLIGALLLFNLRRSSLLRRRRDAPAQEGPSSSRQVTPP